MRKAEHSPKAIFRLSDCGCGGTRALPSCSRQRDVVPCGIPLLFVRARRCRRRHQLPHAQTSATDSRRYEVSPGTRVSVRPPQTRAELGSVQIARDCSTEGSGESTTPRPGFGKGRSALAPPEARQRQSTSTKEPSSLTRRWSIASARSVRGTDVLWWDASRIVLPRM